jgi:uncharacterized protein YecT (DUF1311 family)
LFVVMKELRISMKPIAAAALGALFWAVPAVADPLYDRCVNGTKTNTEWADCGAAYLRRLDDVLSKTWKRVVSRLDKKERAELLREQRAWLRFRDSACAIYLKGYFGREGQVLGAYTCRAAIRRARIADLNALADMMR